MRIGTGYDSHRLIDGRRLVIGGVEIPYHKGLAGHSDADVLCHACIDAIIGALGLGDIGTHFPDNDDMWKDASSINMLAKTLDMMRGRGYRILWLDATIIAERPKLADVTVEMKKKMSSAGIPLDLINIKVKTNEGMGFIGRGEGVAAQAVCLLGRENEEDGDSQRT